MDDDETNQQTNDPAKQFRTLLLAKTKNLSLFIKDMQRRRVHSLVFNSTKYQQISPSFIMFDTSKEREKGGENLIIQKKMANNYQGSTDQLFQFAQFVFFFKLQFV